MRCIFHLDGCEPYLSEVVGGKAVGLASLLRENLPVPPGFALGTHAYREFVSETGLDRTIHELLEGAESLEAQADASERIRLLFEERELGGSLRDELGAGLRRARRGRAASCGRPFECDQRGRRSSVVRRRA